METFLRKFLGFRSDCRRETERRHCGREGLANYIHCSLLHLALPLAQSFKLTMVNTDKNKNDHGEEKPTMDPNRPPISLFRNSNRTLGWRVALADSGLLTDLGFPDLDSLRTSAARRTSSAKVDGLVGAELLTVRRVRCSVSFRSGSYRVAHCSTDSLLGKGCFTGQCNTPNPA
ncbi:hypothetical protein U1Q18_024935 [Sarracenia purpurea var. burkii]